MQRFSNRCTCVVKLVKLFFQCVLENVCFYIYIVFECAARFSWCKCFGLFATIQCIKNHIHILSGYIEFSHAITYKKGQLGLNTGTLNTSIYQEFSPNSLFPGRKPTGTLVYTFLWVCLFQTAVHPMFLHLSLKPHQLIPHATVTVKHYSGTMTCFNNSNRTGPSSQPQQFLPVMTWKPKFPHTISLLAS